MINEIKLGVATTGGKAWLGGVLFVELFIRALSRIQRQDRPEINFIMYESSFRDLDVFRSSIEHADKVIYVGVNDEVVRKMLGDKVRWAKSEAELYTMIDLYFPINSGVAVEKPAISWIPDFQHCYYPDFFSPAERASRDIQFKMVADYAKMIVFSGKAVKDDFLKLFPQSKAAVHVLKYHLLSEDSWYKMDPLQIQGKYKLPDQFALCCNQFWIHKNHKILFEAIALLRRRGKDCHVVFTGKTEDYRWPGLFDQLIRYTKDLGITDLVHVLGTIPREDQIQLLRRCSCVVQPSLFEGLSLIVCEARALGKPILLSDIPVHREQEYGIYFDPRNADYLATKLNEFMSMYAPGPNILLEEQARKEAENAVDGFAEQCLELVKNACAIFGLEHKLLSSQVMTEKATIVTTLLEKCDDEAQSRALEAWPPMSEDLKGRSSGLAGQCLELVKKARAAFGLGDNIMIHQEHVSSQEFINQQEMQSSQEPISPQAEAIKEITVATSLMPGNVEVQSRVLASWRQMGVKIVSLNAGDELEMLKPLYPDVEFIRVERDARQQYGKPYVYFDDVLTYLENCGSEICGIVNSDIILQHGGLRQYIEQEAQNSMLFGCRIDISSLEASEGSTFGGYDFFFFDRNIIKCYPREEFCIGLPWWDYWAVLCPIAREYKIKNITTPVAFHLRHKSNRNINSFYSLGQKFSEYIDIPSPDKQTMTRFGRIVKHLIENRSEHVCLPED